MDFGAATNFLALALPADFSTAYRYYYSNCYGGNCAECEFYGWSQADIDAPQGMMVILR